MKPVVLSGYYGFGNVGDEAILEQIVASLRSGAPGVPLRILSADPAGTARRLAASGTMPPEEARRSAVPRGLGQALAQVGRAGLLISGGGGLLQEKTSQRSLFYYLALLLWARARGVPRVVFGQGVGPLWRGSSRRLTRLALEGAALWVRDRASQELLESLGLAGVQRAADPVFAASLGGTEAPAGSEPGRRPLGVILRPGRGPQGVGEDQELLEAIVTGARARGVPVRLIPFQPSLETAWARNLAARVSGVELEETGPWQEATLAFWLQRFRGLQAVVSARYHGLVLAALVGRPALGLAVDPKLVQLAAELGPEVACLAPSSPPRELEAAVARLLDEGRPAGPDAVARLRSRAQAGLEALARRVREHDPEQDPGPDGDEVDARDRRFHVLGVPVDPVSLEEAAAMVAAWCQEDGAARQVITANPELAMNAQAPGTRGDALRAALARADLSVADGVGLVWGARILGQALPGRVAGADLAERLCAEAARRGWRLFLWGGEPGVAQTAAERLRARWPGLKVVGTEHGYLQGQEEREALSRLWEAEPHLLLVGLGAPLQEIWIDRLRAAGKAPAGDEADGGLPQGRPGPARVMMGVGGVLDVWAGRKPRAPGWVQWLGLEWLYRTLLEPRRLRRLGALPRFVAAVLAERVGGEGER